jgi:hypothetical protein
LQNYQEWYKRVRQGHNGIPPWPHMTKLPDLLDDCHRIANPGLVGHVQHGLLINDPDGIPGEHCIADTRWHPSYGMDGELMLRE